MPYVVSVRGDSAAIDQVVSALTEALATSPFTAWIQGSRELVLHDPRLRQPRPYWGQRPGDCAVGRQPRPPEIQHRLEAADWLELGEVANDALDRLSCAADVWFHPPWRLDVGAKMWVRRGRRRRVRHDVSRLPIEYAWGSVLVYDEVAVWNHGTPDQFADTKGV